MKNLRKIGLYLSLMLLIIAMAGCTQKKDANKELTVEDIENVKDAEDIEKTEVSYPIEVEDKFGNKETIDREPMRIVSLSPNNTEILFALGLEEKIIGVTSNCNYPQEATTKEIVGGYEANLEKIIELDPDLALLYGNGDEEEIKMLRNAGIKVLRFMPETIDEIISDIKTIGRVTSAREEADILVDSMMVKKEEIVEKVKGQEELKVFYEIWHDPLMAAGKGSFMDEIITLSGGKNIAEDADGAYPEYDLEQLIERDPEIYFTSANMSEKIVESIKIRPGFENISAVKNDRVYIFEGNDSDIVSRPGPRIIEALEIVAKSIYPELFK